jgi:1-deoxy-D-xylulose 5-phosphate reductoisomerase
LSEGALRRIILTASGGAFRQVHPYVLYVLR